ncbi:unnamed protein product [Heterobilharzia americana]|nr:unnamed protein product [Heterobilharzia americana]
MHQFSSLHSLSDNDSDASNGDKSFWMKVPALKVCDAQESKSSCIRWTSSDLGSLSDYNVRFLFNNLHSN